MNQNICHQTARSSQDCSAMSFHKLILLKNVITHDKVFNRQYDTLFMLSEVSINTNNWLIMYLKMDLLLNLLNIRYYEN